MRNRGGNFSQNFLFILFLGLQHKRCTGVVLLNTLCHKMKKRTSFRNLFKFSLYLISERIISSDVIRFNERPSVYNSAILVLKGEKKLKFPLTGL